MPRAAFVPLALKHRPFTLDEAREAGLDRWHLQTSAFRRLGPGLYAWSGLDDSPRLTLAAARLRLPSSAAFSGLTAAWLHGLDVEPADPIDVTVDRDSTISGRAGIRLRKASLAARDMTSRDGWRVTTIERTLADVCVDIGRTEAVVLSDAATYKGITTIGKLGAFADRSAGRPGVVMLREVIRMTEPKSESPMESRLRMLFAAAGLPRPLVQAAVYDRDRNFIARLDLYYPDQKLGIEYDGASHRVSIVEDLRRQNRLLAAGVRLLRFTAADVYQRPQAVVDQVRGMLHRGA